ncbi:HNH endonuclease signature motif containing protein [Actinophytocola oryzae]|uniref:HNH endonuclease n=1 Tax=Actinophytocola oryzae TaxID=502181 RepID=A0A4R7VQJ1_9PSEU|nr:HNH endonuclease signature motif containing protein [Actinophytocola oryzae]TDV52016.1 HNH endonuclease [Actinophytocola oryzae]
MDKVIAELLGRHWDRLSDDELLASVRRIEAWSRQLYAVTLAVTKEVDSRGLAGRQGVSSTAVLLRQLLRLSPRAARRRVEDATDVCSSTTVSGSRVVSRLPGAAAALRSGTLSEEQLGVVRRTLRELPDDVAPSVRVEVEQRLVGEARRFDPSQLGRLAVRIRAHLDPDGVLRSERNTAERMELSLTQDSEGVIRVRGRLSAEGAAVLRSALSPLAKPLPQDKRSAAKRRADALVELARRVLNAGTLPVEGGVRPHVGLTVDIAELRRHTGVVDLDWGGTVSIQTARRICCDAEIIPIVMRGGSQPLDVGRRQRLVTGPLRRALIARDRGCVAPGCDRPPEWCDAHHLVHWSDGGATSIDNTALLCGYHHTLVHQGGWTARMIDGIPHFIPPPWIDPAREPQRNTLHHFDTREAA